MVRKGYRNPRGACSAVSRPESSANADLGRSWDFTHQLHDVALGIMEANHPEVVGFHRSDQARRCFNLQAHLHETTMCCVDVRDVEIEDGTGVVELWRTSGAEHQAHAAAVEESHVACGEQQ